MTPEEQQRIEETLQSKKAEAISFFSANNDSRIFTIDDSTLLIKITDDDYYVTHAMLGSGAQGSVYIASPVRFGQDNIEVAEGNVAVKLADLSDMGFASTLDIPVAIKEASAQNQFLEEIGVSKGFAIGKRTTTKYIEDLGQKREVNLTEAISIIPFYSGKDLEKHANANTYGSFSLASMAHSACLEIQALHSQNVLHKDIKPANILWDTDAGVVKVVDYDSAARLSQGEDKISTTSASDRAYMAPECPKETGGYFFSKATDVYSLGKTLDEKFNLSKPYYSYTDLLMKKQIEKMMDKDPSQRPSIDDCVKKFASIRQLGDNFINFPDDSVLQGLGKQLVALEIYINKKIPKAMLAKSVGQKLGITANQQEKLAVAYKILDAIVSAASQNPLDTHTLLASLEQATAHEKSAQGLLSSKGELRAILDSTKALLGSPASETCSEKFKHAKEEFQHIQERVNGSTDDVGDEVRSDGMHH